MKVEFKDFYGQYIDINNETASGNVRMRVRTTQNMNDVARTPAESCPLETDISLNGKQLRFLIQSLTMMVTDHD